MIRRVTDEDAAELTEALRSPLSCVEAEGCALPEDVGNLLLDRMDDLSRAECCDRLLVRAAALLAYCRHVLGALGGHTETEKDIIRLVGDWEYMKMGIYKVEARP